MKKFTAMLLTFVLLVCGASWAAAQETDADAAAMHPVLDSVMRAMIECNCAYSPDNSDYFWTTLAMLAVNWNMDNPLCDVVGEELRVPRKLMQEYAAAAFLAYDDLLPIGEDFRMARYDEAWDAYMVGLSDMGDSYTRIAGYDVADDGTVRADIVMGSPDVPEMYAMTASLAPNPYADAVNGGTYQYSVAEAALSEVAPAQRTRTVLMQGEEEQITETRHISPYGYELWYDAQAVRLKGPEGEGYEEFVPVDPDALMPVSLTIVPADLPEDEAGELLREAVADHAEAGWTMSEVCQDKLGSGLACQVCEGVKDGVMVRLYQIQGALGVYAVTATFPEESIEGYGTRLDIMVKTLTDEM